MYYIKHIMYIDLFFCKYIMNQDCSTDFECWCALIEMGKQFFKCQMWVFHISPLTQYGRLRLKTMKINEFLKSQKYKLK